MTNFEAWRDSLTPETFYEMREAICLTLNRAWPCAQCPAWDYCNGDFSGNDCKDTFNEWANAPAKEEETK